jgi:hypothetical protein
MELVIVFLVLVGFGIWALLPPKPPLRALPPIVFGSTVVFCKARRFDGAACTLEAGHAGEHSHCGSLFVDSRKGS